MYISRTILNVPPEEKAVLSYRSRYTCWNYLEGRSNLFGTYSCIRRRKICNLGKSTFVSFNLYRHENIIMEFYDAYRVLQIFSFEMEGKQLTLSKK